MDTKLYKHVEDGAVVIGTAEGAGMPGTPQKGLNAPFSSKEHSRQSSRVQTGKKMDCGNFLQISRIF